MEQNKNLASRMSNKISYIKWQVKGLQNYLDNFLGKRNVDSKYVDAEISVASIERMIDKFVESGTYTEEVDTVLQARLEHISNKIFN